MRLIQSVKLEPLIAKVMRFFVNIFSVEKIFTKLSPIVPTVIIYKKNNIEK